MSKYIVNGGKKLHGKVVVEKSKNAILPIMAASLLVQGKTTITNVPNFSDITAMAKIIESLGAKITFASGNLTIDATTLSDADITCEEAGKIRASVFLMGPVISRMHRCKISKPGGCAIGARPIDIHLSGFEALGVCVQETQNEVLCVLDCFSGGEITLRMASVGATENLIMCSVLGNKTTILHGVAKEPEIVDLCKFLIGAGANIVGEGTDTITIVGVSKLKPTTFTPIADRIVAGTYMLAVALCGGRVQICDINAGHNQRLIDLLARFGCKISCKSDRIYMSSSGFLQANCNIVTGPYPEFATDLQSQIMAVLAGADGVCTITENMFESRFKHVAEFNKMGANIVVHKNTATIFGNSQCYHGQNVKCHDLRGGAGLVISALAAKGTTIIDQIDYIGRGYENFEQKLDSLGADIHRIEDEEEKHNWY